MKRTPIVLVGFIAILTTLLLATFTSPFLIRLFVPTTPITDSSSLISTPGFSDLQVINTRLYDSNSNGKIEGIGVVFSLFVELPQLGVNAIEFSGKLTLESSNSSLQIEIYSYPLPSSKIEFQDPGLNKFITIDLFFPFRAPPSLINNPVQVDSSKFSGQLFKVKLTIFATYKLPFQLAQLTILDGQDLQNIDLIAIEMLTPNFSIKEISREGTDETSSITLRGTVESLFPLVSFSAWLIPTPSIVNSLSLSLNDNTVLVSQINPDWNFYSAIPIQVKNSSFSITIPLLQLPEILAYVLSNASNDLRFLFPVYTITEIVHSGKTLFLNGVLTLSFTLGDVRSEIISRIPEIREKDAVISLTPLDRDNNTIYEAIQITVRISNSSYPFIMLNALGAITPIVLPKTAQDQNGSTYSHEFPSAWFFSRISYGASSDPVTDPLLISQVATLYEDGTIAESIDTLPAFVLGSWESTRVEILSINKPTFSPSLGFLEFSATVTIYSTTSTTVMAKVGTQSSEAVRPSSPLFPLRVIPIHLKPGVNDYPIRIIFPLVSSIPIESKEVSTDFYISFETSTVLGVHSVLPSVSLGSVTVLAQSFRLTNDVYFNSLPAIGKSSSLEYRLTMYPANLNISFTVQIPSTPKDFISQKMAYYFEGEPIPIYYYLSTSKFLQLAFPEDSFNLFSSRLNDVPISQEFMKSVNNNTILLSSMTLLGSVFYLIATPPTWNPFFLPNVDVSDIYLADWGSPSFGIVVEKTTITLSDGTEHSVFRVDDTEGFTRYYDTTNRYLVKLVFEGYVLELVKASISVESLFSKDSGSQLLKLFLFSLIGLAILSWIIRDVRALLIQRKGQLIATEFLE